MKSRKLAVRLPPGLIEALNSVCKQLGLRKGSIVEEALREKIEDLLDAEDLREAVKEATGFHPWEQVRVEAGQGKHV